MIVGFRCPPRLRLAGRIYGNMVSCMKTTVEIPDELLIEAKKRAAELRRPLRSLIEEGLRTILAGDVGVGRSRRREIEWITVDGGLPPGLDLADRAAMHDWLREHR